MVDQLLASTSDAKHLQLYEFIQYTLPSIGTAQTEQFISICFVPCVFYNRRGPVDAYQNLTNIFVSLRFIYSF